MKRTLLVGASALLLAALPGPALASTTEIGPCNDPNSIVVRVGQHAKVCVLVPPINDGA